MTDIQQTPGDRLRFEVILKALVDGGNNLAILSEHDLVLDFYANLLDERLRAIGPCEVEFCFSTNSERLVQKFNDILSELTVDQALEKDAVHAPRRYLVFRDSILIQDFELQLLARLVNGFPAGNISVILLINSAGPNRGKLDAFGKSLLQWEVETRAGAAKQPIEGWVAEAPPAPPPSLDLPVVDQVVQPEAVFPHPPAKPSWRIPGFGAKPAEAEPAVAPAPLAEAPPTSAREADLWLDAPASRSDAAPETTEAPDFSRPPRKTPWGLLALVAVLSIVALVFMYRDVLEQEVEAMRKYLLRGTPAPVSSVAAPVPAAQAEPATPPEAAAEPAASPVPATAATPAASAPEAAAPEPVREAPVRETPPAAVAAETPVKRPPAPEAPLKAAASPAKPQVDARSDEAWEGQLAAGGYVVQLAAFDTEEEILAFKRSNPAYAKAHVLRVRKKEGGKRYYVLVAGPLASKAEAQALMQSNPLFNKGWLRTAKSLQSQL